MPVGIFDFFKPNVEKLEKQRNIPGLIKALRYEVFRGKQGKYFLGFNPELYRIRNSPYILFPIFSPEKPMVFWEKAITEVSIIYFHIDLTLKLV